MPSSYEWQRYQERARNHTAAQRSRKNLKLSGSHVCYRCGKLIDLGAVPNSREGWTLDHVPPLIMLFHMGADPNDPAYHREAHRSCNSSAGARTNTAPIGKRTY